MEKALDEGVARYSGSSAKLFMRYEKSFPSAQGMAIHEDLAFILYHTGYCAVCDLETRSGSPLAVFPLGSANEGVPSPAYINHANQCMFSTLHYQGNPLPLLYVTTGNMGGGDENGFYYRCAVENILLKKDGTGRCTGAESRLVQTISYSNENLEKTGWLSPCWGCPAWFVDSEKGRIYLFSAKYRTTRDYLQFREDNRYIITEFIMPQPEEGTFVRLTAADIIDQFTAPFDILFTQGGTLAGGKIYYTFGFGDTQYPNGLRVYDLAERRLCAEMDLSGSVLGREEIECCAFYKGSLLCNTNAENAGIYDLGRII